MPRQIDVQCPKCGFVEQTLKEIVFFEEEASLRDVCPQCAYPHRTPLPPRVHVSTTKTPSPPLQKCPRWSAPKMLPEEVRKIFAEELFDPCSCGSHAPSDLLQHDEDCHVRQHSFMQEENILKETD